MTWPRLASRLAEKWALYLEFLQASLEREPDGPQAWRWQIKARVLTYLLARYGSDPTIGVVPTQPYPDSPATPPLQRTFAPPRPRQVFTERLERIAQANDLPPEEQSHLAEDLNRRSPTLEDERDTKLAVFLWVLFAFTVGASVAVVMVAHGLPVALSLAAAISVWAVVFAWWFIRS